MPRPGSKVPAPACREGTRGTRRARVGIRVCAGDRNWGLFCETPFLVNPIERGVIGVRNPSNLFTTRNLFPARHLIRAHKLLDKTIGLFKPPKLLLRRHPSTFLEFFSCESENKCFSPSVGVLSRRFRFTPFPRAHLYRPGPAAYRRFALTV